MDSLGFQNHVNLFRKPLTLVLYQPEKWTEETLTNTIDCMILMLQKGLIDSLDDLFELYAVLFNLIDIETNSFRGECKISEDLKLHVIHCAKIIIDYLTEDLIIEFCSKPSLYPILGHSIHVYLNLGLKEKYKELQITSIVCLNCLIKKLDSIPFTSTSFPPPSERFLPADILASFLPGISIAVMKIVLSDDKLPQKLYIECLATLESTVKAILSKEKALGESRGKRPDFVILRNREWLQSSCSKLDVVFEKIIKTLLVKQSTLIKMKLLSFSQEMIYTLADLELKEEILITLLEVSLIMVTDNDPDLQESSQLWLKDFSTQILINKPSLRDSLLDRLYQQLTTITRELQCISEEQKIVKFKVIEGYFICLGPQGLTSFLTSQSCQHRLLTSLINCASLNEKRSTQGYKLIEMLDLNTIDSRKPSTNYPVKIFKNFDSPLIEQSIKRICSLLGQYLNNYGLIDYFGSILSDGSKDPTIIFICNHTIEGIRDIEILESLFHEYINQLTIFNQSSNQQSHSIQNISLLMEGITIFASKFGSTKQPMILLNCLYLVLASTGSDKTIIADSALITLQRLANIFSYSSIKFLITENIDYIINHLSVKLKNFESNRQVCPVIYAILNLTGLDILPYSELTIDNILISLDIFYNLHCDVLVDLLKIITSFIEKNNVSLTLIDHVQQSNLQMITNESTRKEQFIQQLTELLKARKIVDSLESGNEVDDVDLPDVNNVNGDETEEEEKKQLPIEINITIKILERCCHLLSNPSIDIQIITMEIIMKGLRILKPWEDEILPLAHKLWTPILKRFKTDNLVLLTKCYLCLIVMGQCCGDFLRTRTLEQVIPRLISFLRSQYTISYLKTDSSPYKHTLEYKFQCQILGTIGLLSEYLKVEGLSLYPIIEVVIPYLTNRQPLSLQEEAIKSCKHLLHLDPYAFNCYTLNMIETKSDSERKNYSSNLTILSKIQL